MARKNIPIPTTATPRVERLRAAWFKAKPSIDIERAKFMFEMYESGKLDDLAPVMINAKLLEDLLRRKTIYIEPDQIFVGSYGSRPKATPIYPEAAGKSLINELRKSTTREIDPFEYSESDRQELEYILNNMKALPALRMAFYDSLDMEHKKFFLKYPEKGDYATITQICSIDPVINGGGGHVNPDFQGVIEKGFNGFIAEAEVRMRQAKAENDQRAIDFLTAAITVMKAAGEFAQRHADLAKEMAKKETDAKRKAELLRIAECCSNVPMKPASSFYEAIQSVWFVFCIITLEASQRCYSVGRFDQMAYPLYKADIEKGVITQAEAQEMLDCFWMKFTETNHFNTESFVQSVAGFAPQQQFVSGGQTRDGKDASNDLSYMQIQASINTRLAQPSISLRLWEGTPDALVEKACELARLGTGHPSFFNDKIIVPGLVKKDVILEDARDYGVVGCSSVQPTRRDKGSQNGGYVNLGVAIDLALNDGYWKFGQLQIGAHTGDAKQFKSFEEFRNAVQTQFAKIIKIHSEASVVAEEVMQKYSPSPFLSCVIGDCITRGRDRTDGGAFYNYGITARAVGFADLADTFAVVKKLVFEDKKITMEQLVDACRANWEGYDALRHIVETEAPKYGNDLDYVDNIAKEFTEFYCEETDKYRSLGGGKFHPGFSTVSANVAYGRVVAALPNGRKDFAPLTDGVSPCHHMDVNGPTAVAISAGKLDQEGMTGGSILNLRWSPAALVGDEGLKNLKGFVKGAMEAGIWHMQFNVNDAEMLQDAKQHPEEYQDLLVRVAGYSALFVALPENLQNDIIDRTVHVFVA